MALAGASPQLDNGLAVKAISDPAAASAAALVRIEAGSFQAPTAGRARRICWSICCFAAARTSARKIV